MTSTSILGIFFLIELALVASGLAVYLFFQLKHFKLKLSAQKSADEIAVEAAPTLHDMFDSQIIRTRKKLTERLSNESEEEDNRQRTLLSQRIEFLKFEKEIMAETVTDQSYWKKVCDNIAHVISINNTAATPATQDESQAIDDLAYKKRADSCQQQLANLQGEFDSCRKYSSELASNLSATNNDETQDKATSKLLADYKEHEKHLHDRLNKLQEKNVTLQSDINTADVQAYIKEQKSQNGGLEMNSKTASEEEINRLRDIIGRQYGSIDELRSVLTNSQAESIDPQKLNEKLLAVEQSQEELKVCAEMLEIENQRLTQELETSREQSKVVEVDAAPPKELYDLRLQCKELNEDIKNLNQVIVDKDARIAEIIDTHEDLQKELLQMYTK